MGEMAGMDASPAGDSSSSKLGANFMANTSSNNSSNISSNTSIAESGSKLPEDTAQHCDKEPAGLEKASRDLYNDGSATHDTAKDNCIDDDLEENKRLTNTELEAKISREVKYPSHENIDRVRKLLQAEDEAARLLPGMTPAERVAAAEQMRGKNGRFATKVNHGVFGVAAYIVWLIPSVPAKRVFQNHDKRKFPTLTAKQEIAVRALRYASNVPADMTTELASDLNVFINMRAHAHAATRARVQNKAVADLVIDGWWTKRSAKPPRKRYTVEQYRHYFVDKKVILYYHGGGFVVGAAGMSMPHLNKVVHAIDKASPQAKGKVIALSVEYPLAPEHPFPAAINHGVEVVKILRSLGVAECYFGGDSAGGSLILAILQSIHKEGIPGPDKIFLFSPWLSLRPNHANSFERNRKSDYLPVDRLNDVAALYIPNKDDYMNSLASPLLMDTSILPPTFLVVGDAEVFFDDCIAFAKNVQETHGDGHLKLHKGKDMPHAYPAAGHPFNKELKLVCNELAAFLTQ